MMDGIILPQGVVQHQHQQQQQKQQSLHRSNSSRKDTSRRMAPSRKSEVDLLHKRKEVISHAIEELGRTITKLNESSGFETAFQALDTESMKQYQHSRCKAGRANAHLNRYNDIVPYDASRVVLHKCTPDYINASHIQQLMPGTPNFIATQGPTKTSTRVFWEMVAEYNTGVIVMVTNTIEGSRIKCDQYWPDINDTVTFEPEKGYPNRITVEHVDEQDGFTWSERVFSLRINDNEPRRVVQYHFTDWPDYGTPLSAVPPVVDETTLRAFSSFGINLRSAAGEPRDLSTLGRKRDGRVVPGVYEKELKVLLKVLMNHKQHIVESLALSDDKDTADKLSSLLDDLGPWEHPNVPLPELWRPITLHTTPVNDHRFSLMSTPSSYALDGIEAVMQSGEYLDTGIRRAPIHHSSWLEFDKGYRPVHFTANEVASQPEWADPDIEHEYALLSFNNIDEAYGIDRRSYLGLYKIMQGVPRNPLRRTGISGRGVLGRWGPNHFQTTIVTRWRYLSTTGVQQRAFKNNLPVMEVLLKIEHGELHLPTDRRQIALEFPPTLQEYFGFDGEIDVTDDLDPNAICSIPEMVSNAYELYKGVPADDRSTDNAWVELISLWMHCPDECNLPKEVLDGADYVWAPLHCRLDLDDPSLDLLQTVANTCNVYFSDQLPRIVRSIMQEVERRGITTEGLYRVSGSQTKVIATKDKLLEEGFGAVHDAEIPVLTSVLKLLLKEMTPPLLTHALYDDFIACLERTDDTARHQALSAVLQKLPQDNYRLLDSLIRHLKKVAAEEEANRMGIQNLSLVFGPSIMKSPRGVVNDMSDHGQQILVRAFNEQGGFYQDNFFENLSETYVEQDEPSLEASQAAVEGEEGYVDENGYDEYGGYYDEYGGYYDVEGGYTDAGEFKNAAHDSNCDMRDTKGNYYEPGSWVPDTITYLEGEVTWVIRGKRSGLRRGKETKTKKWLFLQGEMVFLYELTDMECENPIKTIVVDNTWKATREKMRVILKHRDSTELVIQLEDKDTAKQWVEAFRAAIDGTLEETAVGEEYLQIGDEETQ
ncbi:hypothetical protein PTSG_10895 [Salpingoeca rosetta]|uniref:Uncharacterized protein n=1 Tax=Salpingoeca rosetta (strain ATCC 50818 / BSB-021) TaxID=946362 RepID=F2URB3_SALR5|nr:uncharacterized protein PTSG_10895 [Salpingoeca rosetta]EGD80216.1 hypothetical protein PTSG_10895 [Salpingoeca rosetta]|eukprot:XP_004988278.1 hypothetical protein PTSG_10895 [Salpingoeca rosetta]